MKKVLWIIVTIILFITVFFCGCQEEKTPNNQNLFENITLQSNVVELSDASLNFISDNDVVYRVDVKYLFHNIAGRDITIKVYVEFFDKENNLINTSQPKYISLLTNYTEQDISPANIISYSKERVTDVDHIKIIAEEE